ncbi:MAG: hypothetical protein MJZ76_06240 [Bacteroidales bacterium]|nr:hypothetical protein [Bacteroidales bacterium]
MQSYGKVFETTPTTENLNAIFYNRIIPFSLVEIPMFPPYVGNIGMVTYLVGVMAAAEVRYERG